MRGRIQAAASYDVRPSSSQRPSWPLCHERPQGSAPSLLGLQSEHTASKNSAPGGRSSSPQLLRRP